MPMSLDDDAFDGISQQHKVVIESDPENAFRKIATFFDDPVSALSLLREHLQGKSIVDDAGKSTPIDDFLRLHSAAYLKRNRAGTPHGIELLRRELNGAKGIAGRSTGVPNKRARNLDQIERVRDRLGPNREMYGRYKSDIDPFE